MARVIGGSMKPKSAEALRQVPINAYLPVRDAIAFLASASAVANFAVWLSVYRDCNVPPLRLEAVDRMIEDILADLELTHIAGPRGLLLQLRTDEVSSEI